MVNDFILFVSKAWRVLKQTSHPSPQKVLEDEALLILLKNDSGTNQSLIQYIETDRRLSNNPKLIPRGVVTNARYSKDFSYYIYHDPFLRQIDICSSVFNILPLFYHQSQNLLIVSSKASFIASNLPIFPKPNKKFILEQILFNYPLQNETIFEKIQTVPANCYLEITSTKGLTVVKHTKIEDYFVASPAPWKKSVEMISDLFLERVKDYFPDEQFYISLTSGFDGRALTAAAQYHGLNFKTYAFGTATNEDVALPVRNSEKWGLSFEPVYLDDRYTRDFFVETGKELLRLTDGGSSFLQVHHLYTAHYLAERSHYVINGMFGSELLRAMHIRGQITSRALVDFFAYDNENEWIRRIKESLLLRFLQTGNLKKELDAVIDDLRSYKRQYGPGLNKNQLFYKYIFEEAFRKTFGYFILCQLPYVTVRAPYLDFLFLDSLLKTGLAGVNNEFFTDNPLKRFRGQALYAHIIKKCSPTLYSSLTGKGYRPRDLVSPLGKFNLAYAYCRTRVRRSLVHEDIDNLGIISGMEHNTGFFQSIDINEDLYNKNTILELYKNTQWKKDIGLRDLLVQLLSANYYINEIFN